MALRLKVFLILLIISVLVIALTGIIISGTLKEEKNRDISLSFRNQLIHIDFALTGFIRDVEADLMDMSSNEVVRYRDDSGFTSFLQAEESTFIYDIGEAEQRIIDIFGSYRDSHTYVNSIYMGRENGSFVRSHKRARPTQYDPRQRPWYVLGRDNPGEIMRTDPYSSVTTSDINIGVVTALIDREGGLFGVLGMDVTLAKLSDYFAAVDVGYGGWMEVIDGNGIFLMAKDASHRSLHVEDVYPGQLTLLNEEKEGLISLNKGGEQFRVYYITSSELGWKLLFIVPDTELSREAVLFVRRIVLVLVAAFTLVYLASLLGLQLFIIKPISRLKAGTENIAQTGNLDYPITVEARDEIGQLAASFRGMIASILRTERALKDSQRELKEHRDELEKLVGERTAEIGKLSQAVEHSPVAIIITNKEGEIEYVNPIFSEITGYSLEEVRGKSPLILRSAKTPAAVLLDIRKHIEAGTVWKGELVNRIKNGEERWQRVSISPIFDQGRRITHYVAVEEDITECRGVQDALRESEEKFRIIADYTYGWESWIGNDGGLLWINPAVEWMTGYSCDECLAMPDYPAPLVQEKDLGVVDSIYSEGLNGKAGNDLPFRIRHKDGRRVWVAASWNPVYDKEGNSLGFRMSVQDFSERRQMEERFKSVFENSTDCYFIMDDSHRIFECNITSARSFAVADKQELYGRPLSDFAPPLQDENRNTIDVFEEAYAASSAGRTFRCECKWRKKDGSEFPSEAAFISISLAEKPAFLVVVHNLSELKRHEEEIIRQKGMLESLINSIPDYIFYKDTESVYLGCNNAFATLINKTPDQIIGKTEHELYPTARADLFCTTDREILSSLEPMHNEAWEVNSEGHRILLDTMKTPITTSDGRVIGLVGISRDITERKNMELQLQRARAHAEEANLAKSDFLAHMSHEIRTPMNAIIGLTTLALQTPLTRRQADYLTKIKNSSHSLLGIINDILDFSKIEAGKLEIEEVEFQLEDVFDSLSNLVSPRVHEKGLEFLFLINRGVPARLIGDPLRLSQVLINLAGNAAKFTAEGEIKVSVVLEESGHDRVQLKFCVKDTGIGLSQEKVDHIFEPFTQADSSTTREYGGSGLGLAISRHLVELMGGKLGVKSKPGEGCSFFFTAEFGLPRTAVPAKPLPSPDLRGIPVLVIDDNATSRQILFDYLSSLTFRVTLSESGERGLAEYEKALGSEPYRLVFIDYPLTDINTLEIANTIKGHSSENSAPQVILVLSSGGEENIRSADAEEVDGFLIKPINQSLLYDTIIQAFSPLEENVPDLTDASSVIARFENFPGPGILLVEDNEINQQVARELLENAGLKVSVAANGLEAVSALREMEFCAVLMDLQMPVMDGYSAAREIRKDGRFKDLPIIAMTANAMVSDKDKSFESGMDDYITKPIDPEKLFSTLEKWLLPKGRETGSARVNPPNPSAKAEEPLMSPLQAGELNIAAGLKRVGGKRELYFQLLNKFIHDHSSEAGRIEELYGQGNEEEVRRRVHSLKGVAGTIGAPGLSQSASRLEAFLRDGTAEGVLEALADFSENLQQVLIAIGRAVASESTEKRDSDGEKNPLGVEAMLSLLSELAPYVKGQQPRESKSVINKFSDYRLPVKHEPQIAKLISLVNKYRFREADSVLKDIMKRLQ